jgi:hypothetical protein
MGRIGWLGSVLFVRYFTYESIMGWCSRYAIVAVVMLAPINVYGSDTNYFTLRCDVAVYDKNWRNIGTIARIFTINLNDMYYKEQGDIKRSMTGAKNDTSSPA